MGRIQSIIYLVNSIREMVTIVTKSCDVATRDGQNEPCIKCRNGIYLTESESGGFAKRGAEGNLLRDGEKRPGSCFSSPSVYEIIMFCPLHSSTHESIHDILTVNNYVGF